MGSFPGVSQQHGVLVLDKPEGPTSTACLELIKKKLGQRKIGHAGTLDPMATGVLLVLLGQGTKLAPYLLSGEKVYRGELQLGMVTDTYDRTGTIEEEHPFQGITPEMVSEAVNSWLELTEQEVPAYSAAKHKGKPLYALKRAGKDVPVKIKPVDISLAEVLEMDLPRVSFRVRCSQGTYIRSLAHSLGKRLGCGAALTALVREQSHPFALDTAHGLDEVLDDPAGFSARVIPLAACLPHWPKLRLEPEQVNKVKNGVRIAVQETEIPASSLREGDGAMVMDFCNEPLALVEAKREGDQLMWSILRGLWT